MKEAIEFEAPVENGIIAVPEEYRAAVGAAAKVKVTVMEEDNSLKEDLPPMNTYFELQRLFEEAQDLNLFADIEDPVEWQKKLRDEWE